MATLKQTPEDLATAAAKEPSVSVNGATYRLADLSPEARKHLQAYSVANNEVRHLTAQLGMIKTARKVYEQAFTAALPASK